MSTNLFSKLFPILVGSITDMDRVSISHQVERVSEREIFRNLTLPTFVGEIFVCWSARNSSRYPVPIVPYHAFSKRLGSRMMSEKKEKKIDGWRAYAGSHGVSNTRGGIYLGKLRRTRYFVTTIPILTVKGEIYSFIPRTA